VSVVDFGKAHVDGCQVFTQHKLGAHNVTIEDNVIFDFGQGVMASSMPNAGNCTRWTFRRNIVACGTEKYGGAWGVCIVQIPNTTVEHNTFSRLIWYGVGLLGPKSTGGLITGNICTHVANSIAVADWRQDLTRDELPLPERLRRKANFALHLPPAKVIIIYIARLNSTAAVHK
jgi:hypothetical protein